jgi:hypothetical protein
MWLPGWGQGGQANSARCGAQPQKWLRASGIARRRTEPGWRAAVLDERASRHVFRLRASEEGSGYQAPASASGASNVKGASRGVLPSGSDDDGGGFTARCASSLKKRLRASGIARRRTEKERAEAFFPLGATTTAADSLRDARAASKKALAVDLQLLQGVAGRLHEFGSGIRDRRVVET